MENDFVSSQQQLGDMGDVLPFPTGRDPRVWIAGSVKEIDDGRERLEWSHLVYHLLNI